MNRTASVPTPLPPSDGRTLKIESNPTCIVTPAILPAVTHYDDDGNVIEHIPAEPCPSVLNTHEVARFLRFDSDCPEKCVERLRAHGLRGVLLGKHLRYRIEEVQRFVKDKEKKDNR